MKTDGRQIGSPFVRPQRGGVGSGWSERRNNHRRSLTRADSNKALDDGCAQTRHLMSVLPPVPVRTLLPRACALHCFLAVITSLNDGHQTSGIQSARRSSLLVEHRYRCFKSREGDLECDASQGGFWFSQRTPHHDQGTWPPIPRQQATNSHPLRIRWLTKRITSILGCIAPTSVRLLIEVWTKRGRMN